MPYARRKVKGGWQVYNSETGQVKGGKNKPMTEEESAAQIRLLRAMKNNPSFKPRLKSKKRTVKRRSY